MAAKKKPVAKKATKATAKKKPAAKPSARRQKPATRKPTASRKPAKKPAAKKAPAKKSSTSVRKSKATSQMSPFPASALSLARRPSTNPELPPEAVVAINADFGRIREKLDQYAAHLRPLDRARLNSVGIKLQGFIERSFMHAMENMQFLPQFLPFAKFADDFNYWMNLRTIFDMCVQLREYIWNLTLQSADMAYTDALEYYATVREASKRRVDGAESIHRDLKPFFTHAQAERAKPTKKQSKRDFNSLNDGKRDGKMEIENVKPKLIGGKHEIIDEQYKDDARFKETAEGEMED